MRYEILDRQKSVIVFDNDEGLNYAASCQVFTYGDRGFLYNLNGVRFYRVWSTPEAARQFFLDLGVVSLEGYVGGAHARLLRTSLKDVANVEFTGRGHMSGHPMEWVRITPK